MYTFYATPREANHLKFSVWNKDADFGHALFVGNHVEISHFLENNDIKNLEVSALDLLAMQSYDPVTAEEWLNWYYRSAFSALEGNIFNKVFSKDQIRQSVKSFTLSDFSGTITLGLN